MEGIPNCGIIFNSQMEVMSTRRPSQQLEAKSVAMQALKKKCEFVEADLTKMLTVKVAVPGPVHAPPRLSPPPASSHRPHITNWRAFGQNWIAPLVKLAAVSSGC